MEKKCKLPLCDLAEGGEDAFAFSLHIIELGARSSKPKCTTFDLGKWRDRPVVRPSWRT